MMRHRAQPIGYRFIHVRKDSSMSDPTIEGVVHFIDQTNTYGQKGFRKRLVVLEQDSGRFSNYIPVEFTNDDCQTVDEMNEGDEVEIAYRLSGRKWQRDSQSEVKYFLNAEAISFKVTKAKSETGQGGTDDTAAANEDLADAAYDEDDVPF